MPRNNIEESNENNKIENQPNFEVDEFRSRKKRLVIFLKYFITSGVAAGIVVVSLHLRNYFAGNLNLLTTYRFLADAFTFPAAFFILLGLLVLIARQGTFNGLLYALRHVGRMMLPFLIRDDITYAEFLDGRGEHKKGGMLLCFFIVGGVSLVLALIFILLFVSNGG